MRVPVAVSAERATLGEGPRWDAARGELLCVDLLAGLVRRSMFENGRLRTLACVNTGAPTGVALPAEDGGWVLARGTGFARLDESGAVAPLGATGEDAAQVRVNDAACDSAGRLFAGTMTYDTRAGAGALWRLDAGRVTKLRGGATIPNGLGWTADGATMLWVDSGDATLWAFRYDSVAGAPAGEPDAVVRFPAAGGAPDGIAVDADDHVWVALWGGGEVRRYGLDGRCTDAITLPVSQPTACCLGGADGRTLFVTSATYGLDAAALAAEPDAGRVFAVEVEVAGPPARPWTGAGA